MKEMKGKGLSGAIWIFIFIIFANHGSSADVEFIKIGGIFDSEVGPTQELAFKIAVDYINSAAEQLYEPKLVARTEQISQLDSFGVSKVICKMIKDGVVGIFDPTVGPASRLVQSICASKGIPYIKTTVDYYPDKTSNLINLYPNPAILLKVYADLVEAMEWDHFTVLYENAQSLTTLNGLLKHTYDDQRKITFTQFDDGTGNYRVILQNAKASGETNFILDCSSTKKLYDVLLQAQQIGLLIEKYSFIITSPDLHTLDLEAFMHGGAKITGIRLTDPRSHALGAIKRFWNSSNRTSESDYLDAETISTDVAMILDAVLAFSTGLINIERNELMPINCEQDGIFEQGSEIIDNIKKNPLSVLTGLTSFDESGLRTNFVLNVLEFTSSGIEKIGTWNSHTQTLNLTRSLKPTRIVKKSIGGKKFVVLISLSQPFGFLKQSAEELHGNDRFEGFSVDMIEKISQILDFEYELKIPENGMYGYFNIETKEWNGMIGSIINQEADLIATDLTITPERAAAVDFTMPFMNLGIGILYRKPQLSAPDLFFFLAPFSFEVWLYIAVAFLGVSLLLYVLARMAPKEWKKPDPSSEKSDQLENQFGLLNSMWFTGAGVVQQKSGYLPMAISTRMVACLWWFFTFFVACFYIANLVSYTTIESYTLPISSVEDLVNTKNGVAYGAVKGGATLSYLKNSVNPMYNKMYEYMVNNPQYLTKNANEGVNRVQQGNYAYLMESTVIEYITERQCELTQLGGLLNSKGFGIAMRKNSPYRDALNNAILKMQDDGTLASLKQKWWKEKYGGGSCLESEDYEQSVTSVGYEQMAGLFLVLFIGCIVAVFVACIEMICGVAKNSHKHKVSFRQEFGEEWRAVSRGKNTKPLTHTKELGSEFSKDGLKRDALPKEPECIA